MARYERVSEIYDLLWSTREPQSLESLCGALGAAPATVKRLIRFLRERGTPIEFVRDANGYVLDRSATPLPMVGPSFNAKELSALLTAHELLAQIPPGVFRRETASLRNQLQALLYAKPTGSREIRRRVRLLLPQQRTLDEAVFRVVLAALNSQRRLRIAYRSRSKNEDSLRAVSPVRLTFYRSNWYLAAWCHRSHDLRIFSVDRIASAESTPIPCQVPPDGKVEERLSTAYGIFEGAADSVAKLQFGPAVARWIADEQWHPDQRLEQHADGSIVLHVPYRHATELVMDVLRYGGDVKVLAPDALRRAVHAAHSAGAAQNGE
ncbi:MAG: WYL domain-containing protein [Kofleriaceae bacterium]|nr:WYL domain-containing protein [Kofleriaceae bacterium]